MVGRVWGVLAVAVLTALMVAAGSGGEPARADEPASRPDTGGSLATARPEPPPLVPADRQRLLGRWVPVSGAGAHGPRPPFIEFGADGRWSGSDGCNGQAGGWTLAGDGGLRATAGPSTMMACDGEPVGGWMSKAARAAFQGKELVLVNAAGVEQGRLRRAV